MFREDKPSQCKAAEAGHQRHWRREREPRSAKGYAHDATVCAGPPLQGSESVWQRKMRLSPNRHRDKDSAEAKDQMLARRGPAVATWMPIMAKGLLKSTEPNCLGRAKMDWAHSDGGHAHSSECIRAYTTDAADL